MNKLCDKTFIDSLSIEERDFSLDLCEKITKLKLSKNKKIINAAQSILSKLRECINDGKIKQNYIGYEEDTFVYCLDKDQIKTLIDIPINPYTGNLVNIDFYKGIGGQISKYNEIKDILDTNYLKKDIILSKKSTDWINIYTGTYMNTYNYYQIPPEIRLELTNLRLNKYDNLYRGISFTLKNLDYFKSFIEGGKNYQK